ncbi:hypothetical protein JG687_00018186, partial [Phytophthora cactorum]
GRVGLTGERLCRCEGDSVSLSPEKIHSDRDGKSEYGGPLSFDKDQVDDAVDMMRMAATATEYTMYMKYLKYLYSLLQSIHRKEKDLVPEPNHSFLKYFTRNWDSMKERWALYARSGVPHLGKHTNNRLAVLASRCRDGVHQEDYGRGQMRYDGADEELKTTSQRSESVRISIGGGTILAVEGPNNPLRPAGNSFKFVLGSGDGAASYHVDTVVRIKICHIWFDFLVSNALYFVS